MANDLRSMWRPARVISNRAVAEGSMWISLEAVDESPAAFQPGHVLGLGIKVNDASLMRHAYTVSRGQPSARRFEHLYRVVSGGRMSPLLAELSVADEVFFHGPFHTPIQHEIQADAERIILMSTGAGVGPLYGYAEKTLTEGETRPITLFAGFREEAHACLRPELQVLADRHSNFEWHFAFTRPPTTWKGLAGRVSEVVPALLDRHRLDIYHFHLVGNGEMVHLVRTALYRTGVSSARVTIETYFNHHAEPSDEAVEQVVARFATRSGE